MLPFATYTLPESPIHQTAMSSKWLFFILDQPLSPLQKELLQKMASAVKGDFDQDAYCLILEPAHSFSFEGLLSAAPSLIISFGLSPAQLGLWMDLQGPGLRFLESFAFILTLPLQDLEKNGSAKKELWKNMQMYLEMKEHPNE